MQIKLDKKFETNFNIIFEYIAKDKISAAKKFKTLLFKQLKNLPNYPHKSRKSLYFNNEKIRDMIFKGYTVVYEVDIENSLIIILNIFHKNQPL